MAIWNMIEVKTDVTSVYHLHCTTSWQYPGAKNVISMKFTLSLWDQDWTSKIKVSSALKYQNIWTMKLIQKLYSMSSEAIM